MGGASNDRAKTGAPLRLARTFCLASLSVLILTTGCATSLRQWASNGFKVGPQYRKPVAPVESQWIDFGRDPRLVAEPVDTSHWWTVFDDPQLNDLVRRTSQQNISLREAGTRILQAQAVRRIAAGNVFPQLQQAFGSYDRVQISRNVANSAPVKHLDQWGTGFNLSWELDFWGRFRRSVEAADASLDASIEGYDNVLVLLVADTASTYVTIRTLQAQLALLKENVRLQRESLGIADAQFKAGKTDESDVLQTRNNVEQTESLIPQVEASLRQANNALCVLLGIPPQDLLPALGEGPIPAASSGVLVGIPAELLRRRPDVRQAERIVAAQSAQIGVAEAELYPHFALNGALQWQARTLDDLTRPGSMAGSVGPSFAWNILNYGRIASSVRQQQALFEQAVFAYQSTVLTAQREAEDALVGFLKAQDQTAQLQLAVNDITKLTGVLLTQANAGSTNFDRLFVVQAQQTAQQSNLAAAQGSIALNLIAVYRALGGGWQIRLAPSEPSMTPREELLPMEAPPDRPPPPAVEPANRAEGAGEESL